MAKVSMMFPHKLEIKLSKLPAKVDEISCEVLEAGGKVAYKIIKESLDSVVGTSIDSRSTGELQASLGVSPPKLDRNGNFNIKVGFNEPRRKQYAARGKRSYYTITNAMIANIIEHGKHGQPARPFLARAKRKLKKPVREAMIAKFNEEVGKL